MKHHVMLDLETLGTKPGCPIISIGAVVFATGDDWYFKQFYTSILPNSQERMQVPEQATLAWWDKQPEEARAEVFNNVNSIPLYQALIRFVSWTDEVVKLDPADEIVIWGKGATFDEPIIAEALKRYDHATPWTFRDSMCFRTLIEVGKMAGITEPVFEGVKHNALSDAMHQAKWADKIMRELHLSVKP